MTCINRYKEQKSGLFRIWQNLLAQLHANVHTIVLAQHRRNSAGRCALAQSRNTLYECQHLAALNEQTQFAIIHGNVRRHRSQTTKISHLDFLVLSIKCIVALNGTSAQVGSIGVILVKGKRARALLYTHFGQVVIYFALYLAGSHCATSLSQEIFAFKHTVGTRVVPCAYNAALRKC